jgi:hypothetical protein
MNPPTPAKAPMTNAERQAAYRTRRREIARTGDGFGNVSLFLPLPAKFALMRVARHRGLTMAQLIEQWAREADDRIVATLDTDAPEWDQYFTNR